MIQLNNKDNFIHKNTDLKITSTIPFNFGRFYNSISNSKGILGYDFNHSFEMFLRFNDNEENNDLYLTDELGSQIDRFTFDGDLLSSTVYDEFGLSNNKNVFTFTGYQYDDVADTYFAQAREYDALNGRFLSKDIALGLIEYPFSQNRYTYCFNSPMILVDLNGAWPEWIETAAKVVTATVAVVAVGAVIVGTGGLAATVVAGAAAGGVVGGFANEKRGGSYINGWTGGVVAGASQTAGAMIGVGYGSLGGSIGGAASSYITDSLDNIDPYSKRKISQRQKLINARKSAEVGAVTGFLSGVTSQGFKEAYETGCYGLRPELQGDKYTTGIMSEFFDGGLGYMGNSWECDNE